MRRKLREELDEIKERLWFLENVPKFKDGDLVFDKRFPNLTSKDEVYKIRGGPERQKHSPYGTVWVYTIDDGKYLYEVVERYLSLVPLKVVE
jgi:hypothetical protein